MPKVPEYDGLSVGATPLTPVELEPFRANDAAGSTGKDLGAGMLAAGTGLNKMALRQQKLDETQVLNQATNEYLKKELEFKEANQERRLDKALGMTRSYETESAQWIDELGAKLPASLRQKWTIERANDALRSMSTYSAYEAGQRHEYRVSTSQNLIGTITSKAVLSDNMDDFNHWQGQLENEVYALADLQGIVKEEDKARMWDAARQDLFTAVIKRKVELNPETVKSYYEGLVASGNNPFFDQKVRTELDALVKTTDDKFVAENWVESNWPVSKVEVTKKFVGDQQNLALQKWEQISNAEAADLQKSQAAMLSKAFKQMDEGGGLSAVDAQTQHWLERNYPEGWKSVQNVATGANTVTDPAKFAELSAIQRNRPDDFKRMNLNEWRQFLKPSDFQSFLLAQQDVAEKNEYSNYSAQVKTVFKDSRFADNKAAQGEFEMALRAAVDLHKSLNGGALPDEKQHQAIIDSLLIEGEYGGTDFFGLDLDIGDTDADLWKVFTTENMASWRMDDPVKVESYDDIPYLHKLLMRRSHRDAAEAARKAGQPAPPPLTPQKQIQLFNKLNGFK